MRFQAAKVAKLLPPFFQSIWCNRLLGTKEDLEYCWMKPNGGNEHIKKEQKQPQQQKQGQHKVLQMKAIEFTQII